MTNKTVINLLSLVLILAIFLTVCGCSAKVQASDLMDGVSAKSVNGKEMDQTFKNAQYNFSVELFKNTAAESEGNVLVSPLSVSLALSMTMNGAEGETLAEYEKLYSDISITELNEYLYSYQKSLPSSEDYKLGIANSIWFRDSDSFDVRQSFLETNASYYNAAAYRAPFDETTVDDINNWVSDNTDGLIEEIIDELDTQTLMHLINAVMFDAKWHNEYDKGDVNDGKFTAFDGTSKTVKFMNSEESKYLECDDAVGFIKDYKDGKYSFAALLPNQDILIDDYVQSLSGEKLENVLSNVKSETCIVNLPKFESEFEISLNEVLKTLGVNKAFDPQSAEFGGIGTSNGNLFIGNVLHKTYISVDEKGTKAAAVTDVAVDTMSMPHGNIITLNRPFVYMIIDNHTNLPIFIGTTLYV